MNQELSPSRRFAASWPHHDASREVRAGGFVWYVQSFGTAGPQLLFLHGTGASTHSWRDLVPLLESDFRLFLLDLPGHGRTRTPPGFTPTLPKVARAVGALLDAEGCVPDIIVGHSAGAAVAIEMVLDGFAAPQAIVSLNGALLPFRGAAARLFPAMARLLFLNPVAPAFFSWRAGDRRAVERLIGDTGSRLNDEGLEFYARLFRNARHVRGALRMMAHWDLESLERRLPGLSARLVLVAAERDRAVPPASAERVAKLLPDAEIRRQAGLGHLSHEEDPAATASLIRAIADEGEIAS